MRPIKPAAGVIFWPLLWLLWAAPAVATIVPVHVATPCLNADSPRGACDTTAATRLTDLDAILVWGQRCGQRDSSLIGTIPARGLECSGIDAALDLEPGGTYWIWTRARDTSGNLSRCRGPQLVLAVAAQEFRPGLWGEYYDNIDFTGFKFARGDRTIDFEWGLGAPDTSMGPDKFSILWTGKLRVPYPGVWTFYTLVEDGSELTVGPTTVISDLAIANQHESSGSLDLAAGLIYPVTLRYVANNGHAGIVLSWSHAQQAKEIVPPTALEQP